MKNILSITGSFMLYTIIGYFVVRISSVLRPHAFSNTLKIMTMRSSCVIPMAAAAVR